VSVSFCSSDLASFHSKQTSKPTILSSAQQPASAPLQHTSTPAAAPSKEPEPEPEPTGWEEPTTVQHPSWEPDPSPAVDLPSEEPKLESPVPEESQVPSRSPTPAQEPAPEPTPATVEPPSQSPAPSLSDPATTSVTNIPASLKSAPRTATSSSRASARNRLIDQPVVMPSSFGSVERVGMQFGSLSLNGESLFESTSTSCVLFVHQLFLCVLTFPSLRTEPETPAVSAPASETAPATTAPGKPQHETSSSTAPAATTPAASASLGSVFQSQQQAAQVSPATQPQSQTPAAQSSSQPTLPTSVSQPTQSTQTPVRTTTAVASPLQQYTHQPHTQAQQSSLAALQQQQQPQQSSQQQQQQQQQNHHQLPQHHNLPQQVQQSHTHHQYSQHFPTQVETQQQHLPSATQHQQPQTAAAQSNYFRQNDTSTSAPYFHTPTSATGQAQDYSAFNNQLGQQNQQGSHLSGFGSVDYGYDNQRVSSSFVHVGAKLM